MLGSSRTIVQAGQTISCYEADFYPFGGERTITNGCPQNYKFEGKERDAETGNDDFGARYYSSRFGRWLSADWSAVPAPVPYANLSNPQTLNLYAMVADNPETFADLDGHDFDIPGGAETAVVTSATTVGGGPCASGSGNPFQCGIAPPDPAQNLQNQEQRKEATQPQAQNQQPMTLSQKGLDFIKRQEGFKGQEYQDSAGNSTIGYGHLIKPGENFDKGITKTQAEELLKQDVKAAVGAVNDSLRVKVSQNQFDALVSFTFNLGSKNLQRSTLSANINAGQSVTKENFTSYNHAGGKVVPGLTVRRTAEFNLFSKGSYGGP